jgi:hypothetical protein
MLPPTRPWLEQPDTVPYFLWDVGMTVTELRRALDRPGAERDRLVACVLREANSRDVWPFLDWAAIEEAWPRIQHRLGRARGVWQLMIDHHLRSHGGAVSSP